MRIPGTHTEIRIDDSGLRSHDADRCSPLLGALDLANIVIMLFLLTVLLIAVSLGLDAALLSAFPSVALFDFFFVPPRFSFPSATVNI